MLVWSLNGIHSCDAVSLPINLFFIFEIAQAKKKLHSISINLVRINLAKHRDLIGVVFVW
jgi:hypothetical protein